MFDNSKIYYLHVICGPMFSSKSTTLLSYIEKMRYAKKNFGVFRISSDTRYSESHIVTHNNEKVESISVNNSKELLDISLANNYEVIFIDEVQFFDKNIVDVIETLIKNNCLVIAAGLDQDFAGRGFGPMPELLARAERITKLSAVCTVCGNPATRSQRLINGHPAAKDDGIVQLGAEESYEARCNKCHIVY